MTVSLLVLAGCGATGKSSTDEAKAETLVVLSATAKSHPSKYAFSSKCAEGTSRLDWLCTMTIRDQVVGVEKQVGLELRCVGELTMPACKIRRTS